MHAYANICWGIHSVGLLRARIETRRMEDAAGPRWSDARAPWRKRLTTAQLPCSPPPLPSMLPWHVSERAPFEIVPFVQAVVEQAKADHLQI